MLPASQRRSVPRRCLRERKQSCKAGPVSSVRVLVAPVNREAHEVGSGAAILIVAGAELDLQRITGVIRTGADPPRSVIGGAGPCPPVGGYGALHGRRQPKVH